MLDLITIGDCTIDAFNILDEKNTELTCDRHGDHCKLCLRYADKIPVKEIQRLVAGNAANNAVGASRLGLDASIYTIVGDDAEGQKILDHLKKEGVRVDYLRQEQGTSTNFHTVLVFNGERTILIYHTPRAYRLPRFEQTAWMYLTSMAEGGESIFPELAELVRDQGIKLMYQPGTFQLAIGPEKSQQILKETEIIIMNKEEAVRYLNAASESGVGLLLAGLIKLGPKIAVITDGLKGSYAASQTEAWFLGTRPEIKRVETTGAGDAYATGFLAARSLNRSIAEAMRWGTHNAEGVVGAIGPQAGLLTRDAMEGILSRVKNFVPQKYQM
jgi:sugar/nucleoside kinase (ribokinase family)